MMKCNKNTLAIGAWLLLASSPMLFGQEQTLYTSDFFEQESQTIQVAQKESFPEPPAIEDEEQLTLFDEETADNIADNIAKNISGSIEDNTADTASENISDAETENTADNNINVENDADVIENDAEETSIEIQENDTDEADASIDCNVPVPQDVVLNNSVQTDNFQEIDVPTATQKKPVRISEVRPALNAKQTGVKKASTPIIRAPQVSQIQTSQRHWTQTRFAPNRPKTGSPIAFGGFIQGGGYGNSHGAQGKFKLNEPVSLPKAWYATGPGNGFGHTNTYNDGFQLNQASIFAEKKVSTDGYGIDFGGRIEGLVGTDARFYQSHNDDNEFDSGWGDDEYGWAIKQAYGEVAINRMGIKVGKFSTPLGNAKDDFFYSNSITWGATPVTHVGALTTFDFDRLTLLGGWTKGENRFFSDSVDDSTVIGGFKFQLSDTSTFSYTAMFGDMTSLAEPDESLVQSLVFDTMLSSRLNAITEILLRSQRYEIIDEMSGHYENYAISQSFIYQQSACWSYGLRAEWMRANSIYYQDLGDNHCNLFEVTLGAQWTPYWCSGLAFRPEVRYDFSDNLKVFGRENDKKDQFGFGAGVEYRF